MPNWLSHPGTPMLNIFRKKGKHKQEGKKGEKEREKNCVYSYLDVSVKKGVLTSRFGQFNFNLMYNYFRAYF